MQRLGAKQSDRVVEPEVGLGERGVVKYAAKNVDEEKTGEDDDGGADRESKLLPHTNQSQPVMPAVRHHPEEEERDCGDRQQK